MTLKRAVFIDRDGTINEESGYLYRKEDCRFIPGSIEAIAHFSRAGFLAVVVTNQSGIARGYYNEADLQQLHLYMSREIAAAGGKIAGWYHCPHHPDYPGDADQCDCRKPLPGMLQLAAGELGIDLASSWMIGDKLADIEAGLAAGCQAILVKTGYGEEAVASVPKGVAVLADLQAAAAHIIDNHSEYRIQ
jgi:D-glycero-D-manno-heptose 1,7-bisphosphate phosphatase